MLFRRFEIMEELIEINGGGLASKKASFIYRRSLRFPVSSWAPDDYSCWIVHSDAV